MVLTFVGVFYNKTVPLKGAFLEQSFFFFNLTNMISIF